MPFCDEEITRHGKTRFTKKKSPTFSDNLRFSYLIFINTITEYYFEFIHWQWSLTTLFKSYGRVFKTMKNIYDGAFCGNGKHLFVLNYFPKKFFINKVWQGPKYAFISIYTFNKWEESLCEKWCFPLRISSVHVTKSAGNCRFGHIYWRNP